MSKLLITLSSPAKRLMAQFRYSVKFALISLIFIIPLVLSLILLQYEYAEEVRFTNKELTGLELINLVSEEQAKLSTAIALGTPFTVSINSIQSRFESLNSNVVSASLDCYLSEVAKNYLIQGFAQLNILSQSVADYSNLELDAELTTSYLVTAKASRISLRLAGLVIW
jgi:methyl-accepting chemotaxis protein